VVFEKVLAFRSWYPLEWRLCGPHSNPNVVETRKVLVISSIQYEAMQPVASHFTGSAIPSRNCTSQRNKLFTLWNSLHSWTVLL